MVKKDSLLSLTILIDFFQIAVYLTLFVLNGPAVGVDNNLPDPRSRSQAKQSLSSILTSREADVGSLAKLAGWLRMEVPPPILAVFLPCRLP